MIFFLVQHDNQHPLKLFLEEFYKDTKPRIEILPHEAIKKQNFFGKTVIFCDHERIKDEEICMLRAGYEYISNQNPKLILNSPRKMLGRYEMHQTFLNDQLCTYESHTPPFDAQKVRFPAFLRQRYEHYGMSKIFTSASHFESILREQPQADLTNTLLVEYVACRDPASDKLHVKYGAFYLNGQVIPRHYLVSDSWIVKSSIDSRYISKEKEYQLRNPHEYLVRKAFIASGLDYGRIDYSFDENNQIQTFEINTNPTAVDADDLINIERMENTERFANMFRSALETLI